MIDEYVTNKDVKPNIIQLFSHGPEYQSPQTFVGRDEEKKKLIKEMNDSTLKVVILSDLLGSGKSFFIDMSLIDIGTAEKVKPFLIRSIDETKLMESKYPFVIIDDIDVRNSYKVIKKKLGIVNKILNEKPKPIFLIGDYTVRNDKILSMLPNADRIQLKMEPLNKKLLIDALNKRIEKELKHKKIGLEQFEDIFLNYLLPNTEPNVATFREVFAYLGFISNELPENTEKCFFSSQEVRAWLKNEIIHFPTEDTKKFYQFLIKYIEENYSPEKEMKAIETSTFRELCPIQGINSDDEYEEQILRPFTEKGILKSFGIPFSKDTNFSSRFASPYLPSVKTFLEAKFGGD